MNIRVASLVLALLTVVACGGTRALPAQVPPSRTPPDSVPADSLDPLMVPAGFGSLKQDAISIRISPSGGLQLRAVPLDERILRLLSPDSYRSLREILASKSRELASVKERLRLPSFSIWYVSFYTLEQGETRFSPGEFIINNVGRDFRPLDIIPLSTGFGEYRLKQREVQSALMVFDGQVDINQPITAQLEGTPSRVDWTRVMEDVERERALVRSRAAAKTAREPVRPRADT